MKGPRRRKGQRKSWGESRRKSMRKGRRKRRRRGKSMSECVPVLGRKMGRVCPCA